MVKPRQSIRFWFLSVLIGILIVGTLAVSTVIAVKEMKILNDALIRKGRSFAFYIADLSLEPLIMKDGIQLDGIVDNANNDEDIRYAVVRDAGGNLVTSEFASINHRWPRLKRILSELSKESRLEDIITAINSGDLIEEVTAPVVTGADVIGTVTVGVSKQKVRDEIAATILYAVALNLAGAFVLGAVFFVASKKMILNPVAELAGATSRLAKGDLSVQVKIKTGGEIQVLADSFNSMAKELRKRTRSLVEAQEELVRREKLALLGRIAENTGNELRNPLGVMNNAVFFLKTIMPNAGSTVAEYLDIIKTEIDNAQCIILDLHDFCRARKILPEAVSTKTLVRQTLANCRIPPGVAVQSDITEKLPKVKADPGQIEKVLRNLIVNSVQAMPEGGTLRIAARRMQNPECVQNPEKPDSERSLSSKIFIGGTPAPELRGDFIEISVSDTGEGIAQEDMEKIFQPLFTTKSRGMGLGLTIARQFAEANGGSIKAESHPGRGSTFVVALPVHTDERR